MMQTLTPGLEPFTTVRLINAIVFVRESTVRTPMSPYDGYDELDTVKTEAFLLFRYIIVC